MDVDQPEELLKLSLSGNTVKALLKAHLTNSKRLDSLDQFLLGNEVHISFHNDGLILYLDEKYIIGFGKKFLGSESVIKISDVRFQLSTLREDFGALLIGHEEDFAFSNFCVDIFLIENGHYSQFWATFQVGNSAYEIDILEYSYKKYGMEIPVDVSSKDKVKIKKVETSSVSVPAVKSMHVNQMQAVVPPKPVEKRVILPKVEPDTNNKTEDEDLCKICMMNDVCTINLPCGHIYFCIKCSHDWKQNTCPSCRTEMNEIKKIFK